MWQTVANMTLRLEESRQTVAQLQDRAEELEHIAEGANRARREADRDLEEALARSNAWSEHSRREIRQLRDKVKMLGTRLRNLETREAEREAQAAEFEEEFDHCKHEACEEPADAEVARELELFVTDAQQGNTMIFGPYIPLLVPKIESIQALYSA